MWEVMWRVRSEREEVWEVMWRIRGERGEVEKVMWRKGRELGQNMMWRVVDEKWRVWKVLRRMHMEAEREVVESPHVLETHKVTWWRVVRDVALSQQVLVHQ